MTDRLIEILGQVKSLAQEYCQITGKPLGVTGEIAEFEAARLIGVELCRARQEGYDAIRQTSGGQVRLQIKGVCFPASRESSWRIGKIDLGKVWDAVLMVLLNPDFEPREIWGADRKAIESLLGTSKRTDPGVKQFKQIGKQLWPITPSTEDS